MTTWREPRLARTLGIDAKQMRDLLRKLFPDHEHGGNWYLEHDKA